MDSNVHKIAVVIPKYGLVGGAENFAAELTERIAQNERFDIHVFANKWLSHSERITFHKVPIIAFPKFLTTISFAYYTDRKLSKMNFDLIHTHDRIFNANLFTMHGIPHRIWVREVRKKKEGLFDYATAWTEQKLVRNQRCKSFLAVSNLVKEKFLQEYHDIHPDKIQVIHPGVDIQRFQRLNRQLCHQEVRNHLGIGMSDIIILFVSMNFFIKGLDNLIMGVAKCKLKHPQEKIKLLVVGKGDDKKYRRLATKLGIKDQVIFLGVVDKKKLDKIYLASDIYSMLSRFDTFGMAVLEAMAASLPVLISRNAGSKDIVRHGINGFILENIDNPDEVADKISFLLKKEFRSMIAEEALKTASMYTWEAVTRKMENIYKDLLGDR